MLKYEANTLSKAFAYLTDCTLATVSNLKVRKSTRVELRRQIGIAQFGVDFCREHVACADYERTRIKNVVEEFDGSVEDWAAKL